MTDPIKTARAAVHHAKQERLDKAAAWWQQGVNEGRALRQARAAMTAGEKPKAQEEQQTSKPRQPRQ